ncbi:MAG TPA: phosphoenolpyruvate--protein phosphotransferase [Opitutales bacterium]|jgi:phosphotransferase system enzyme I (PtsI)|nr:phosphoenolpyruvate--protein phosphotransferase [Opitutales bacterium]
MSAPPKKEEIILKGVPASPGVAHGAAFVFLQKELEVPVYEVEESRRPAEVRRFEQALTATRAQISKLRAEVAGSLGENEARILDAHLLVLEDNALIEETIREVRDKGLNADFCFQKIAQRYIDAFDRMEDEYLRERAADIRDVARRVLHQLLGQSAASLSRLGGQRIVIAQDISPSDTASMDRHSVLAIATDTGSRTSHAVIMARSLQVPAVVGLHDATRRLENNDYVLVDGYEGILIINPTEQTLFRYGKIQRRQLDIRHVIETVIPQPCESRDGKRLGLMANISGPEDIEEVKKFGAEGVGLYRTEALFIRRDKFPDEEEQFQAYQAVVAALSPQPVVIRTLDLGGDKQTSTSHIAHHEANPFMGFRAIRYCLDHPDMFREQLRAILRSSAFGKVKIMYPMISGLQELVQANLLLEQAKDELRIRKVAFDKNICVGSMIEIPSAAWTADQLAQHCSFFSIGTNDLIQYLLAVDRVNDHVAHLYEPAHPAVLRAIQHIIVTGRQYNIPTSICGEMGGDPIFTAIFLGLGADDLSVAPAGLPDVKYLLRNIRLDEAQSLAAKVLQQTDPKNTVAILRKFYIEHMGNLARPEVD